MLSFFHKETYFIVLSTVQGSNLSYQHVDASCKVHELLKNYHSDSLYDIVLSVFLFFVHCIFFIYKFSGLFLTVDKMQQCP